MTLQPELDLKTRERQREQSGAEELCTLLRGRGWLKASAIMQLRPDWTERSIRLFASASVGRVMSFPGSRGYRLTIEASAEERDEAVAKLRHQASEMGQRASAIARVHHKPVARPVIVICPVCNCQTSQGNWSVTPGLFCCIHCFHMGRQPQPIKP